MTRPGRAGHDAPRRAPVRPSRRGPRGQPRRGLVPGAGRRSSTCSCTCRSSSSSLFAFNDTKGVAARLEGFSIRWFEIALDDPVVLKSLTNSFIVAIPNAILATAFGTMAALGLQRASRGDPDRRSRG